MYFVVNIPNAQECTKHKNMGSILFGLQPGERQLLLPLLKREQIYVVRENKKNLYFKDLTYFRPLAEVDLW